MDTTLPLNSARGNVSRPYANLMSSNAGQDAPSHEELSSLSREKKYSLSVEEVYEIEQGAKSTPSESEEHLFGEKKITKPSEKPSELVFSDAKSTLQVDKPSAFYSDAKSLYSFEKQSTQKKEKLTKKKPSPTMKIMTSSGDEKIIDITPSKRRGDRKKDENTSIKKISTKKGSTEQPKIILDPEHEKFCHQFMAVSPIPNQKEVLNKINEWPTAQIALLPLFGGACHTYTNMVLKSIKTVLLNEKGDAKYQVFVHLHYQLRQLNDIMWQIESGKLLFTPDFKDKQDILRELVQISNVVREKEIIVLPYISKDDVYSKDIRHTVYISEQYVSDVLNSINTVFRSKDSPEKANVFIYLIQFINQLQDDLGQSDTKTVGYLEKDNFLGKLADELAYQNKKGRFNGMDFSGLDMSALNLFILDPALDLSGSNFNNTQLEKTNVSKVILCDSTFVNANMKSAIARGTDMRSTDVTNANFDKVDALGMIIDKHTNIEAAKNWDKNQQVIFKKPKDNCLIQ